MTSGTVLALPSHDPSEQRLLSAFVSAQAGVHVVEPVAGPPEALVARVCASISRAAPADPLVIVAVGTGALMLPGVALSQRSLHRRVAEYVLIEPAIPPVTDAWPDAPVIVLTDAPAGDASTLARLRGWTVLPLDGAAAWRLSP